MAIGDCWSDSKAEVSEALASGASQTYRPWRPRLRPPALAPMDQATCVFNGAIMIHGRHLWIVDAIVVLTACGVAALAFGIGDGPSGLNTSGAIAKVVVFGWCVSGIPLVVTRLLLHRRRFFILSGEFVWMFESCWAVYFLACIAFHLPSSFAILNTFLVSQSVAFFVSCALLVIRISAPRAARRNHSWSDWAGILTGVIIGVLSAVLTVTSYPAV